MCGLCPQRYNMAWVDLKQRIRSVNAIVLNAERRFGKDSDTVKYIYKTISSAYGAEFKTDKKGVVTSAKKRFTTPPDGGKLAEIAKIDRALRRIELSNSLTAQGRKETYEKSKMTWIERNLDKNANIFDQFIYAKEMLGSLIYGESSQIIDELSEMPENLSNRDFRKIVKEYNELMQNGEDSDNQPRFFDFLHDRGEQIVNDRMEKRSKKLFYGK